MPPTRNSDALVLFGATGDLAYRKIFPALQALIRRGQLETPIVAVGKETWGIERLRERVLDSIREFGDDTERRSRDSLLGRLQFVHGDYRDGETFTRLGEVLRDTQCPLHYLAIPPSLFGVVIQGLHAGGDCAKARVVVEKPFGRDLKSAQELNAVLRARFAEPSIFRIDHYLGKESVQNLLYFRFANTFLEPIWNRHYVDSVTISMMESFGVEGRGRFYEEVGAIRDVVQNHLLQVVAHVAMEPPTSNAVDSLRDEKIKVLRSVRSSTGRSLIRGQYLGYREEPGVAADSSVETFAAMQLHVDSWRWADVPFFVRAGKCLADTATEVLVTLKRPPQTVFKEALSAHADHFRFRLGPDRVAIALGARVKKPGIEMVGQQLELYVSNESEDEMSAYERLIGDALRGDPSLFTREDAVLESWRIVDPLLELSTELHAYERGTWGPAAADGLGRPLLALPPPDSSGA